MGIQCCAAPHFVIGEDFISKIVHQKGFILANYDYNRLLNELCSIRTEQQIGKKYLQERIIPKFYDKNLPLDQLKYIEALMNYILSQLKQKNNIYEVLILFYPFINHSEEQIDEKFHSTFKYMISTDVTVKHFEALLWKYIHFATNGVTSAFLGVNSQADLNKAWNTAYSDIFTDEAITKFVKEVIEEIKRKIGGGDSTVIPLEAFTVICKKWDLVTIEGIRRYLIMNY